MTPIGTFQSKRWGLVHVLRGTYQSADGPLAIALETADGEPLAKLSVCMYRPDCSHDSTELPQDCFYAKDYGDNEELAAEAMASGLFLKRDDLPMASSGFIQAPVWQVVDPLFAPAHGPWRVGEKRSDDVVADHPCGHYSDDASMAFYGGHLVAESIKPPLRPLIAGAPKMLRALRLYLRWCEAETNHAPDFQERMAMCREAEEAAREVVAEIEGAARG